MMGDIQFNHKCHHLLLFLPCAHGCNVCWKNFLVRMDSLHILCCSTNACHFSVSTENEIFFVLFWFTTLSGSTLNSANRYGPGEERRQTDLGYVLYYRYCRVHVECITVVLPCTISTNSTEYCTVLSYGKSVPIYIWIGELSELPRSLCISQTPFT